MPRAVDVSSLPLWICPQCDRTFANSNQTHSCRPLGILDEHFRRSSPHVRDTFDRILAVLDDADPPVSVLAEKTRIALHVRMSFAAFVPRKSSLVGHLILARTIPSPRWSRIEAFSPQNILHAFWLDYPGEVDGAFVDWLWEAYEVGCQKRP